MERLGHTFEWWIEQPLAFHRWCFGHLQEIDRRRNWLARARQIDAAWLNAHAFHNADSLQGEQQSHIASACGPGADEAALVRAAAMLAEFERGNTLDGLSYHGH